VYLERFRHSYYTGFSIRAVAAHPDGFAYASDGTDIARTDASTEIRVSGVRALAWADERLWAGTDTGVIEVRDDEIVRSTPLGEAIRAFFGEDAAYGIGERSLYRRDGGRWSRVDALPDGALSGTVDASGRAWVLTETALHRLDADGWTRVEPPRSDEPGRWTSTLPPELPEAYALRTVVADNAGHLLVGTSAGLLLTVADGWQLLRGVDGLPVEDATHLALSDDGDLWVGTPEGVCLLSGGRWEYYAGLRWLPDDCVTALAVAGRSAWVGTPKGLSRVERRPFTLEAKAELFEKQVRARHNRDGYVTVCFLEEPGDLSTARHEASDNDGLWTALYVAAECYRYAVTGSPDARDNAATSMNALLRLEEITPIPGFPARAVMRPGEERVVQSRGEWHETLDGASLWKGDTSSDEIDGHVFAFAIYHDLVANATEQRRIAATLHRIASHIVENGFYLTDLDGKPTRWGVWAPERLNGDWKAQQGLNSLEILSLLKTAAVLTGDVRFDDAYRTLVRDHHYALNILDVKLTGDGWVNHSDDELAFLSYYPLLTYETEPHLRAIYERSLERSWQVERAERCPLWNFIYGALTGRPCDVEGAKQTLEELPNDLRSWRMRNSHRADVRALAPPGGWNQELDPSVLPYFERPIHKWNGNPFRLDGGDAGSAEEDGTVFLLPYWMGRYYGFIEAD
jgi:hypothetical protein